MLNAVGRVWRVAFFREGVVCGCGARLARTSDAPERIHPSLGSDLRHLTIAAVVWAIRLA